MTRRLTYAFVKESFESEGYTLLSEEYKNSSTKLECTCIEGHLFFIKWNNWQQGNRCPHCAGNAKLSIEFVRNSFEKEGYEILDDLYINARTKLTYRCPVGHTHKIDWDHWIRGKRCPICAGNAKLSIDFIRHSFEKEGYTLLSEEYINASTKLKYMCPYGHIHSIAWACWGSGNRCPVCADIALSGSGNPSWRGGKSFEEYCQIWKDKEYKKDIRQRDGHICLNPYCSSRSPKDLTIHHIDYDKKNCHPKNLITVCRSCNARANFERKWHKAWYQAILNKRCNYKY